LFSVTDEVPGYLPGAWSIDPVRSRVRFSVGHLGVHTVHGTLGVSGRLAMADDPLESGVDAVIDLGSVDTGSRGRDEAIRSARLLDVANQPTATYRSKRIGMGKDPGEYLLHGDLALLGVTREVPLRIRLERPADAGPQRPVITGKGQFTRRHFGFTYQIRPSFLDRAISSTVTVDVRIETSPAATEGTGR
jgi:polyisoprenoid-binding protein YceI